MSESKGIVLSGPDATIEAKAKSLKLPVMVDAGLPLVYDKTLFVAPGTGVPWDLLPAGWHFLERWDAAVPLWRYGKTAADVGTKEERKRTAAVVRDLRVLLHSVELLFVRDNEDGRALVEAYREEGRSGTAPLQNADPRLAFLRAVYRVKPRLCVLPISWLAEVQSRSKQDAQSRLGRAPRKTGPMVSVEVAPGRFVKCHEGDEERVLSQFSERGSRRRG